MFNIIGLSSLIVCIFAKTPYEYIDQRSFNNGINLNQTCSTYTDCFNCTLAKCDWGTSSSGGSCVAGLVRTHHHNNDAYDQRLPVTHFFEKGKYCGDPKSLCKKYVHRPDYLELEVHPEYEPIDVKYSFQDAGSYIPPNYFCIQEITNIHSLKVNIIDSGDAYKSGVFQKQEEIIMMSKQKK